MDADERFTLVDAIRVSGFATALLVLGTSWLSARFLSGALRRLGTRIAERRSQLNQLASLVSLLIYSAGIAWSAVVSINLTRESQAAVVLAVAVTLGFALRDVVASVVAGIVVMVDRPFHVGDRVVFGNHHGEVLEIGLRSVRMRTPDDHVVTIPNARFLAEAVASGNAGDHQMQVQMDFYVAPNQSVAVARRVVEEALLNSRFVSNRAPWGVFTSQVLVENHVTLRLRARAYVLDVKFEMDFTSDVTERVLEGFITEGIRVPEQRVSVLPVPAAMEGAPAAG